ncbi:hypothetical protein [Taibaiella koreensis]|uniref:hypothetical protein n=1 Tax=Taibaiella koreensis TaxID=1268548 RepID=UPI000E59DFCD|nr:hypothetical protein [Taibaiella koreensis]
MKNFRNTFFFAFLLLTAFVMTNCSKAHAASSVKPATATAPILVYERSLNPTIGVTADQGVVGSSYSIIDGNGRTVLTGTIRSGKMFRIPTGRLGNGQYRLQIGNHILQEFVIR